MHLCQILLYFCCFSMDIYITYQFSGGYSSDEQFLILQDYCKNLARYQQGKKLNQVYIPIVNF